MTATSWEYRYVHSCVDSTYEDMCDLLETEDEVTREEFVKNVNEEDRVLLEQRLGYDSDFRITDDWHVTYHEGIYRKHSCFYLQHSGIEYIFTFNGNLGPSKNEQRALLEQ